MRRPSERPAAVLLGFWGAFEATSWGSRWGAEPLAARGTQTPARLPLTTTQLEFEPLRRFFSVPHHRDMPTSRAKWLGMEVACECVSSFHGSMDGFRRSRTVRSCSAVCWLLAGLWRGYSRRNRTSPRCLLCICAICLVNREAAARSILMRSLVL